MTPREKAKQRERWNGLRRAAVELLHKRPEVKRQALEEGKALVVAIYAAAGVVPEADLVPHACDLGGAWCALVEPGELPALIHAAVDAMTAAGSPPHAPGTVALGVAEVEKDPGPGRVRVVALGWGVTVGAVAG